jgi:Lrp/AsnC family transcriptional regulator, leucine-responsive regulatory protein
MQLDKLDKKILQELQRNGAISNLELAEKIGLSPSPCARRVKQLQESGIIKHQVTLLDASKLQLKLIALIQISMDRHTASNYRPICRLPSESSGAGYGVLSGILAKQDH